jgi:CRISPR/Cas system CMR-associated protein Cmr1 (group 7 of RAMP superfamily)
VLLGGGLRSETALKKSLVDILNWVCICMYVVFSITSFWGDVLGAVN